MSSKVLKLPLHNLVKKDSVSWNKLQHATETVNDIVVRTYQLIRMWILQQFNNNSNAVIPEINIQLVLSAMQAIKINKLKNRKLTDIQVEMENLWESLRNDETNASIPKIGASNLNNTLNVEAQKMVTCFQRHITTNYTNSIRAFINRTLEFFGVQQILMSKRKR